MGELVFEVEATVFHCAQLEQYHEMELVAEILLGSEAFHRPIQNQD
jgi:hypothetical protein